MCKIQPLGLYIICWFSREVLKGGRRAVTLGRWKKQMVSTEIPGRSFYVSGNENKKEGQKKRKRKRKCRKMSNGVEMFN